MRGPKSNLRDLGTLEMKLSFGSKNTDRDALAALELAAVAACSKTTPNLKWTGWKLPACKIYSASAASVSPPFLAERGMPISLAISKVAQFAGASPLAITIYGRAQIIDQRSLSRSEGERVLPLSVSAKLCIYFGGGAKLEGKHLLIIPHEFRHGEE